MVESGLKQLALQRQSVASNSLIGQSLRASLSLTHSGDIETTTCTRKCTTQQLGMNLTNSILLLLPGQVPPPLPVLVPNPAWCSRSPRSLC